MALAQKSAYVNLSVFTLYSWEFLEGKGIICSAHHHTLLIFNIHRSHSSCYRPRSNVNNIDVAECSSHIINVLLCFEMD